MGKKSRQKKERREAKRTKESHFALRRIPYPFEGVPKDIVTKGMVEIGKKKAEQFAITTSTLQDLISRANPICLMSSVAGYGLAVRMRNDGTITTSALKQIQPAHIELLQALCLRLPVHTHSGTPALGHFVQAVCDNLVEWSDEFHAKRLAQLEAATTDIERSRLSVQENIRLATQMVRNWGYYEQVKRIVTDLMAPLEPAFFQAHGFQSADLTLICDYLFSEWQRRINEHWDRLTPMMRASTIREALAAYHKAFPNLANSIDEMFQEMRERRASLKDTQLFLLSHSDLQLTDVFTFDHDDIAKSIGRPRELVVKALDSVSYAFGDLAAHNIEHFFMSNPVWTRPVVKLPDNNWFCVSPNSLFAFWFECIVKLVGDNAALRATYDKRRSQYLERRTQEVFASALQNSVIIPNFKWHSADGKLQFESDLIIHLDSFLIIVECKSGRVPPESRRGAPDSLGEIVDSLLIEPSRQSYRLQEAIYAAQRADAGTEAFLKAFPVDLSGIHRVIRLSVTLEDVTFLQTHLTALKDSGYVPHDLTVAPAVTIADLETVFDVLQSVPERIHYWVRRGEWEERADYLADEIDLLGVYLKTGLDLGELEFGKAHLVLVGESRKIDEYYEATRYGLVVDKPKYQAIPWWHDILSRLETKKPNRWIEAAVVLLCAGRNQQEEIERRTKSVIADVMRRRERARSRNAIVFVPASGRREAICTLVLTGDEMSDRHMKMENIAAQAFESNPAVDQCIVIVMDVDGQMYPYSTFGVLFRPT